MDRHSQTFDLPDGFSVQFTLDASGFEAAWSPHDPVGDAALRLLPDYRKARDRFLRGLGLDILLIEL